MNSAMTPAKGPRPTATTNSSANTISLMARQAIHQPPHRLHDPLRADIGSRSGSRTGCRRRRPAPCPRGRSGPSRPCRRDSGPSRENSGLRKPPPNSAMLRQSVNSADTRNISAGAQLQASSAKTSSQISQPRARVAQRILRDRRWLKPRRPGSGAIWIGAMMSVMVKTQEGRRRLTPAPCARALVGRGVHGRAGGEFGDHLLQLVLVAGLLGLDKGRDLLLDTALCSAFSDSPATS